MTTKEKAKAQIEALPPSMKLVYIEADKCIKKLIRNGKTPKEAVMMVLEVLKESKEDLLQGNYKLVIASLSMIFRDVSVDKAAKSVIKSILL